MIQDRLTAKFLTAKPAKREKMAKPKPAVTKTDVAPAADTYTRGRSLFGSFWL